jgi:pilus assembly protein CpaF
VAKTLPEDRPADVAEPKPFEHLRLASTAAAALNARVGANGHIPTKSELQDRMLAALSPDQIDRLSEPELRAELQRLLNELTPSDLEAPDFQDAKSLIDQVLDELLGFGPLGGLMRQVDISEILINGPHQIFVERRGQLHTADVTFRDEAHLLQVIHRLLAKSGRQLNKRAPMVDARLPDGSRLNAVLNPPAINGPLVSIRRFGVRPLTIDDLIRNESVTNEMLEFLTACVKGRVNLVISGGTGSGKTTLLNALSRNILSTERLVTIEDTAELELQQPHVAKMEAQPPNLDGEGAVTMRDLVRNALRMRPDRIIVGECRGGEALEMLQAMNTGHEGSMTTVHANTTREALARIELMVNLAGVEIPSSAIRKLIASSITLVVQVARLPGGKRKMVTISEIVGLEGDVISMHDIFNFVQTGMDANHSVEGYFQATGVRPSCLKTLNVRGAGLSPEFFRERRLQPAVRPRTSP